MWLHTDQDTISVEADVERRYPILERCRGAPVVGLVLEPVPGTGNTPVDDATLSQRAVLVLAHVGNCRNLPVIPEDGNSLPANTGYLSTIVRDVPHGANVHEPSHRLNGALTIEVETAPAGGQVEADDQRQTAADRHDIDRAELGLEHPERHVDDEEPVGQVNQHVDGLPQ